MRKSSFCITTPLFHGWGLKRPQLKSMHFCNDLRIFLSFWLKIIYFVQQKSNFITHLHPLPHRHPFSTPSTLFHPSPLSFTHPHPPHSPTSTHFHPFSSTPTLTHPPPTTFTHLHFPTPPPTLYHRHPPSPCPIHFHPLSTTSRFHHPPPSFTHLHPPQPTSTNFHPSPTPTHFHPLSHCLYPPPPTSTSNIFYEPLILSNSDCQPTFTGGSGYVPPSQNRICVPSILCPPLHPPPHISAHLRPLSFRPISVHPCPAGSNPPLRLPSTFKQLYAPARFCPPPPAHPLSPTSTHPGGGGVDWVGVLGCGWRSVKVVGDGWSWVKVDEGVEKSV